MMKIQITILFILLFLGNISAIATINAVASFTVLSDIIKNIGGKYVKVTSLVNIDSDPHTFEPTPKNSQLLAQADVVVLNGLGLESWIDRLVNASGYKKNITIASKGIKVLYIKNHGIKVVDPHAWNSINNGIIYTTNIMNALIETDPKHKNFFYKQGLNYINQLINLDNWAMKSFKKIPINKRQVFTSHNAFGYLGNRYGISFLSPVNFSTEFETNANQIANLINILKKNKIHTYFIENQTNSRLIKQIALFIGAKLGGKLYPESLSNQKGPASTYQKAFKYNVTSILKSMY